MAQWVFFVAGLISMLIFLLGMKFYLENSIIFVLCIVAITVNIYLLKKWGNKIFFTLVYGKNLTQAQEGEIFEEIVDFVDSHACYFKIYKPEIYLLEGHNFLITFAKNKQNSNILIHKDLLNILNVNELKAFIIFTLAQSKTGEMVLKTWCNYIGIFSFFIAGQSEKVLIFLLQIVPYLKEKHVNSIIHTYRFLFMFFLINPLFILLYAFISMTKNEEKEKELLFGLLKDKIDLKNALQKIVNILEERVLFQKSILFPYYLEDRHWANVMLNYDLKKLLNTSLS